MERFTEYHNGVPVILDKGEGRRVAAAKHFAELEELATPKKVKMTAGNQYVFSKVGHCPNCGETVRGNMKHCDYCGQRLAWEDKAEKSKSVKNTQQELEDFWRDK